MALVRFSVGVVLAAFTLLASEHALGIMAGAPPDSPAARIDPNTTSSPWSGVGSVVVNGAPYSGVVVAPNFVLTAAHVASNPAVTQFVLNYGGDQSHTISAVAVVRYPTASFPYDDLALIQLASAVPAGVAVYPLAREPITSAQPITLVGYGASGNGSVGVSVSSSRTVKRVGGNALDAVQTALDTSGRTSLFYLYDFDGPTGSGVMGGATLGNTVETIVQGGDSGSPAFIGLPGAYRLVGINTFITNPQGGANQATFGMVGGGILLTHPSFLAWIDATTGYTSPLDPVDIPVFPPWALVSSLVILSGVVVRARARAMS